MRKPAPLILTFLALVPFFVAAQIPVTDVAAGGVLTSINVQTIMGNKLMSKIISGQQQIIANQKTLINLMREQNRTVKHTDELKSEEIAAYKNAPERIIVDYQLGDLEAVRSEIVSASRDFVRFIKSADQLSVSDVRVYEDKITQIISSTSKAWKQTKELLSSTDKIIPAGERQELLQNTIATIRQNVTKIKSFEKELFYINKKRISDNRFLGN